MEISLGGGGWVVGNCDFNENSVINFDFDNELWTPA